MGCCGQVRATPRTRRVVAAMPPEPRGDAVPAPREEQQEASAVAVEYLGEAPVLLHGAASRRLYTFSPARRTRSVPAGDARQLLRNGDFRRAGPQTEQGARTADRARRP